MTAANTTPAALRSAAHYARTERAMGAPSGRAAYTARAANRASRRAVRAELASLEIADALEFDSDELDAITGAMPDWML
jgi:hypothetical protein